MRRKIDITHFRFERELSTPVQRFFEARAYGVQENEVAFFEHRMDIYGYSEDSNLTIAVELKLRDWRKALRQALLYQLCSDYSYVALPCTSLGKVDLFLFEEYGLGLIAVDHVACTEVIPAAKSEVTSNHYREAYVSLLRENDINDYSSSRTRS